MIPTSLYVCRCLCTCQLCGCSNCTQNCTDTFTHTDTCTCPGSCYKHKKVAAKTRVFSGLTQHTNDSAPSTTCGQFGLAESNGDTQRAEQIFVGYGVRIFVSRFTRHHLMHTSARIDANTHCHTLLLVLCAHSSLLLLFLLLLRAHIY